MAIYHFLIDPNILHLLTLKHFLRSSQEELNMVVA